MRVIVSIITLLLFFHSLKAFDTLSLRINFVLIQKSDGSGNFSTSDSLQMAYLKNSVERLNEVYAFKYKKIPDSICSKSHSYTDSGIRFKLNQIIEIKNDSLWDNEQDKNWKNCPNRSKWYLLETQKSLDSILPLSEHGINIYLTVSSKYYDSVMNAKDSIKDNFPQHACSMFPSNNPEDFSAVHHPNAFLKYLFMQQYPYQWGIGTFGRGLAHELGHSLGLTHIRTCYNIMHGGGSKGRKNLTDRQVDLARKNILYKNLKRYLEKDI